MYIIDAFQNDTDTTAAPTITDADVETQPPKETTKIKGDAQPVQGQMKTVIIDQFSIALCLSLTVLFSNF